MIANDLTKMQIDALVSEADIGGMETNQPVNFTVDAFPTRTFHGTVIQIRNAPQTNQNVVTYDTVIGVDNSDLKLRPGMTANVSVITAQRTNVLKIPNGALRFHPPEAADARNEGGTGGSNNAPQTGTMRTEGQAGWFWRWWRHAPANRTDKPHDLYSGPGTRRQGNRKTNTNQDRHQRRNFHAGDGWFEGGRRGDCGHELFDGGLATWFIFEPI